MVLGFQGSGVRGFLDSETSVAVGVGLCLEIYSRALSWDPTLIMDLRQRDSSLGGLHSALGFGLRGR